MSLVATTFASDPYLKYSNFTLSGGDLTATITSGGGAIAATRPCVGDVYFEFATSNAYSGSPRVGIGAGPPFSPGLLNNQFSINYHVGDTPSSMGYAPDGKVYVNGSSVATLATWAAGDNLGIAISPARGLIWFRKNGGNWNNDVSANQNPDGYVGGIALSLLASLHFRPAVSSNASTQFTAKFTPGSWTYSAPSGYSDLSGVSFVATRGKHQHRRSNSAIPAMNTKSSIPFRKGAKMFTPGAAGSPLGAGVSVAGTLKENGSPAARTIRVYDEKTGQLLETVKSDVTTGAFSALCHGRGKVFVVAFDPSTYQAQVYDQITPA